MKFTQKTLASALAATMAATGVSAAHADIELGSGLSVTGFVDMSFQYIDVDGADSTTRAFGVDQVEVDFLYTGANGVSARVDIEYGEAGEDVDTTFVEQAYITKQITEQFSVKAGRFLSYSGWETEEPTGLYQYSGTGYAQHFYGYYQQGVSAYFDGGIVDFMVSVVNSAVTPNEYDTTTLATEVGVALQPVEGLTAKLFYITDDDNDRINFWTSYEISSFTFAFEYNKADFADDREGDGYLLMANYAVGDFGITFRYHDYSIENAAGATIEENKAITISPSYALGDNLLLVAEYRKDEFGSTDVNTFAFELLYSF
jgi:hypothetical protein